MTTFQTGARIVGGAVVVAGIVSLILAPLIGDSVFTDLWGVEPLAYIGAILLMAGLGATTLSYLVPHLLSASRPDVTLQETTSRSWSQLTQQYFELFDHDLGRPLRRILGKERESRAILQSAGAAIDPSVGELLDEIERQTPNFRLMLSNIQVLVQLESPDAAVTYQPVEPSEIVRNIIDRYTSVATESEKELTWWAEPDEFGLVYADSSSIEHIVTNLVDNAVRLATAQVEVKITKNPSHFFIRVWDDGPGIASRYLQHIFDRGWTPEVARREEKSSSGPGLFIARTLANRCGGDLTVESVTIPDPAHHTAFLVAMPLRGS